MKDDLELSINWCLSSTKDKALGPCLHLPLSCWPAQYSFQLHQAPYSTLKLQLQEILEIVKFNLFTSSHFINNKAEMTQKLQ